MVYQPLNRMRLVGIEFIDRHLNPAAQALLIQILALCLVCAANFTMSSVGLQIPVLTRFILQALFAVGFAYILNAAPWWYFIHGLFPIFVMVMLQYAIPQTFYFYGLLATSMLFWTTFRSQVPFFPSNSCVHELLKRVIPENQPLRVIDVGSGLGGLMMKLAEYYPNAFFSGIEIAPLPWMISLCRAKLLGSSAQFHYGNYLKLDFSNYDVIYAYLSPVAMSSLWQKARTEMRQGSLLVSYEFEITDIPPQLTLQKDINSPKLYVWRM